MLEGERDIIEFLVKLFNKHGISYVLTGSFAGSYWGRPRATHDIDFLVEIEKPQTEKIISVLKDLGSEFMVDLDMAKRAIKEHDQFNVIHFSTTIKIDFWVAKDNEFEKTKFNRRLAVKLFDDNVFIVTAEDLVLTKLLWCKEIMSERHMRDCIGILEVQKGKLDKKYLNETAKTLGITKLLDQARSGDY
ncbi:MAG: hypothetical protein AAB838_00560 [Patescibacteria group bacterium]